MKGVNLFLAEGFEDIEALAVYDILTRGGVRVNLISISDDPFVSSSHGLTVGVEQFLSEMEDCAGSVSAKDIMIFPGGMPGTKQLAACKPLIRLMKEHYAAGGSLAAICAAPGYVLSQLDTLEGVDFTCYDGCEFQALEKGGNFTPVPVVRSGRIITGRGPGYAIEFALEILKWIKGEESAAEVGRGVFLR